MDDRPEEAAPPAPVGPSRATPGPPRAELDQRRRAELLDLIAAGKGIDKALRQMGATYRTYRNTCEADPEFREEVASARRAADQELDELGFLKAQTEEGSTVLLEIWGRRDRGRALNQARRDRARERAEEREEKRVERALRLHLAELAAEARAKERAERAGTADSESEAIDLSRLTDEELASFRALMAKVRGDADPGA